MYISITNVEDIVFFIFNIYGSVNSRYAKRQRMRVRTLKDAHNQGPNVTWTVIY